MAGFVKGSRGTIAAGDTTITFEPARPASFGIENRGSRDVTATASPGAVVFDVPAGDARTFNGGAFESVVLSDGGNGDTPYSHLLRRAARRDARGRGCRRLGLNLVGRDRV